jgi:hypothetical protein
MHLSWNLIKTFLILFVPCIATMITNIHQNMHTIYIKLEIIHIHEVSMFQW